MYLVDFFEGLAKHPTGLFLMYTGARRLFVRGHSLLKCLMLPHFDSQARGEAKSALDVVEGFAALNRKLVDELR